MPSVCEVAIPGTEGRALGMAAIVCDRLRSISPRSTGNSPSGCPPMRVRYFFGSVRGPS